MEEPAPEWLALELSKLEEASENRAVLTFPALAL
jgi:hypothetical protein